MGRATGSTGIMPPKPRVVSLEEVCAAASLDQLSPLPTVAWDEAARKTCRDLADQYLRALDIRVPNHAFDVPKWVFLEHLAETGQFVFHGSNQADLTELLPRVAGDNLVGTNRPRVYASSSPLLAMFSAILVRTRRTAGGPGVSSVFNLPIDGGTSPWRHRAHIAVDHRILPHGPWSPGSVYILPIEPFRSDHQGVRWFSEQPVRPLARICISAHEWPMLDRVLAVNLTAAVKRFNDTAVGYPWSDDPDLYPVQRDRPYVRRARAILDKQFAEKISLAALAEQTDVSPYHLQRTFRAATGLSPLHYQANLRVSQARALLCAGRSLSRVAAEVGFGDQSHLTKHFHRVFGISPGRFVSNRKNRQDVGASARNNTNG